MERDAAASCEGGGAPHTVLLESSAVCLPSNDRSHGDI